MFLKCVSISIGFSSKVCASASKGSAPCIRCNAYLCYVCISDNSLLSEYSELCISLSELLTNKHETTCAIQT